MLGSWDDAFKQTEGSNKVEEFHTVHQDSAKGEKGISSFTDGYYAHQNTALTSEMIRDSLFWS